MLAKVTVIRNKSVFLYLQIYILDDLQIYFAWIDIFIMVYELRKRVLY